jgi:polar amino acid transport system substrate-binding protein
MPASSPGSRYRLHLPAILAIIMKKGLIPLLLLWSFVSTSMANEVSPSIVNELAPAGRLRVAINFGNPVLAQKDAATGEPRGVSAALAHEFAKRLGRQAEFIPFDTAGQVFEAMKTGALDLAFLAIDPAREAHIAFTAPYVVIEGTYLVPEASPLRAIEDVDRDGIRVAVGRGAAYHLFLKRELKHARLVEAPTSEAALDLLLQAGLDAAAGVKQPLVSFAAGHANVRVLPGRFMAIDQAMAIPKGRDAGLRYLRSFVEEMKASGFVANALAGSGHGEVTVAPPSPLNE